MADDIRTILDNALAIVRSQAVGERGPTHQALRTAAEALLAARQAIDELGEQLDLVTAPELDAAQEVRRLRAEVGRLEEKLAQVEEERERERQSRELEEHLQAEEKRRLRELERKSRDFEDTLAKDPAAFERFMERALDEQEKRKRFPRGGPGSR